MAAFPSPADPSMREEPILLPTRDARSVQTLTLHTPKAFNALSEAMREALSAKLDGIAADEGARVQGLATAAGCQLVAPCDLAVAAQEARFGVNGVDVGLFCATPSVPPVRNVPVKVAMETRLTGEFISAEEAHRRGLAFIEKRAPAGRAGG